MSEKVETMKNKGLKGWFENITSKDLKKGFAVVLVAAVLSAASVILEAGKSTFISSTAGTSVYISAAISFGTYLVLWLVSSLVIHASARVLKGKGSLRRFLAMNGLAYIPLVIQGLLSVVDVVMSPTIPQSATGLGIIGILLGEFNVFNSMTLILSAVAAMANYDLSRKKAAVAVLIPVVISLALTFIGVPISLSGGGSRSVLRGFGILGGGGRAFGGGFTGGGGFTPPTG
jgi:hypothetical protein